MLPGGHAQPLEPAFHSHHILTGMNQNLALSPAGTLQETQILPKGFNFPHALPPSLLPITPPRGVQCPSLVTQLIINQTPAPLLRLLSTLKPAKLRSSFQLVSPDEVRSACLFLCRHGPHSKGVNGVTCLLLLFSGIHSPDLVESPMSVLFQSNYTSLSPISGSSQNPEMGRESPSICFPAAFAPCRELGVCRVAPSLLLQRRVS